MNRLDIQHVLDAGANVGQYAIELREFGYRGTIDSFEPTSEAYRQLAKTAANDPTWRTHKIGLGDARRTTRIHLNGTMSSIFDTAGSPYAPALNRNRFEDIQVERLDSIDLATSDGDRRLWLKLDVQGYERPVLDGSANLLPEICAIEIEMSLVPVYEGQQTHRAMTSHLESLGFELWDMCPGYRDPASGRLIEFDAILLRPTAFRPPSPEHTITKPTSHSTLSPSPTP